MQVIFLPTSICVLHCNFWYLHIKPFFIVTLTFNHTPWWRKSYVYSNKQKTIDIAHRFYISVYIVIILYRQLGLSLLEWLFYYFHMFRNPVNQFMHLNPLPAVKTFTCTAAESHAWRSRYWRSGGQIVYRRNRRNGARLLQQTLI